MSNRALFLGVAGALLVVVGLLALWFPVYLSQYDQYGIQIACGRGFSADLSQAGESAAEATFSRAWKLAANVLVSHIPAWDTARFDDAKLMSANRGI